MITVNADEPLEQAARVTLDRRRRRLLRRRGRDRRVVPMTQRLRMR
jgi:hypothetical protein